MSNLPARLKSFLWPSSLALAVALSPRPLRAQAEDGMTPPGHAPGAPAGSYALSDLDHINFFNGTLNFSLPLATVGGRGEAGYTVMLPIEQHWGLETNDALEAFPRFNWWRGFRPGYGPGTMLIYRDVEGPPGEEFILTRMTFTAPDGTQHEFRDDATEGYPQRGGINRGRIFRTHDGSQITFVSDADVSDGGPVSAVGYLMFPNGTRYRIEDTVVSWIQDRNGNVVSFEYAPHPGLGPQVSRVTDALNRSIDFDYIEIETPPTRYDTITFQGWGGAPRTIRVDYARLADRLVDGATIQRLGQLFPLTNWRFPEEEHNPWVVSSATLPSGRRYTFGYNPYGELAEVELPTSGKYRYAYGPGVSNPIDAGGTVAGGIYRRLLERAVYKAEDPEDPEMRMTLSPEEEEEVATGDVRITVDHLDPRRGDTLLARNRHYFYGRAVMNLGSPSQYPFWKTGLEYRTKTLDAADVALRAVDRIWQQQSGVWWAPLGGPVNEPRVTSEATRLETGQQILIERNYYVVSRRSQQFDNPRDTWEYAFDGVPVRKRHLEYVSGAAHLDDGIHLRRLVTLDETSEVVGPDLVLRSRTAYDHDNYGAGMVPRDNLSGRRPLDTYGTGFSLRGNVTAVRRWLDTTGGELVTRRRYDVAGNVVEEKDPRSIPTTFDYEDNFGFPDGNSSNHVPPPELLGYSTFAFASASFRPLGQVAQTQTDYYLGRTVDEKDPNTVVTSFWFNDPLDRLTRIIQANSPGHEAARTRQGFAYDDDLADGDGVISVTTVSDKDTFNDQKYRSQVIYDSLGRETESRTYEGATWIGVASAYDARGRVSALSNPYRSGDTVRWTSTTFDALGRPVRELLPDNSELTTSYVGSATTVADQAGKVRKSIADALDRVVAVVEDPAEAGGPRLNLQTNYAYDALDNLVRVSQGVQTRIFTFDSLARLTSQRTPEAGMTTYDYDANGNLVKRTDARAVVTCWGAVSAGNCSNNGYDALDRPSRKTYSDGTPEVAYTYDAGAGPYSLGRLVTVANGVSASRFDNYDALGRILASSQTTGGQAYRSFYRYDRAGLLLDQAYPSGRVVYATLDLAGRVTRVAESGLVYADGFQYFAHGAPSSLRLANNLWESAIYNDRLQPKFLGLGTSPGSRDVLQIENGYGGSVNNGNVLTQVTTVPAPPGPVVLTQQLTYDPLNRLKTASEPATQGPPWSQTYDYDRYGNRAVTGTLPSPGQSPQSLACFDPVTNRLTTSCDPDIAYDLAGNLTRDALARSFSYDAEWRQRTAGSTSYEYDGEGRRVKKTVAGATTVFVYDASGRLVSEYGAGPLLQSVFVTRDHLGSTRAATNLGGTVLGRWDYLPFGEEIPGSFGGRGSIPGYGSDPGLRQKFTGKERDGETGLDYFEARYHSAPQGRFQSPDSATSSQTRVADAQQWNGYAYVRNNPLVYVDPDGESATLAGALIGGATGATWALLQGKSGRQIFAAGARGAITGALVGLIVDTGGAAAPVSAKFLLLGGLTNVAGGAAEKLVLGERYGVYDFGMDMSYGMTFSSMTAGQGRALPPPARTTGSIPMLNPTVAELRGVAGRGYEVHHILPQYLGKMLGYTEQQMAQHPGALVPQFGHTGRLNPEALHAAVRTYLPPMVKGKAVQYGAQQIRAGLRRAYADLGRPEFFDVIEHLIP